MYAEGWRRLSTGPQKRRSVGSADWQQKRAGSDTSFSRRPEEVKRVIDAASSRLLPGREARPSRDLKAKKSAAAYRVGPISLLLRIYRGCLHISTLWSGGDSNSRPLPCEESPALRHLGRSGG